ncbi:ComEC/Rec2 family competence protein [Arthrobacter sp. zg-Y1219]|uniref:ComEC/Rec2 family competence protein n=1 Tax=Arthrobacter sp. zg-Y1219 TaxID=3049067 RepID=UPI0024C4234B|nr:ComEC/Rec2 family competence protein [Arthrobacter sp. zg-Y1219]MDK1359049.1 ComEC/Rec2 family competence protein [Arthrobacter sp. zg-Y1219]
MLELRLVPVAAAAWIAAALAVRADQGASATAAGFGLAGTALIVVAMAFLLQKRRFAVRRAGPGRPWPLLRTLARAAAVPLAAASLVSVCAGALLAERTAGPVAAAIADGAAVTGDFRAVTDARAVAADQFSGDSRFLVETVLEEATSGGQRFTSAATVLVIGNSGYGSIHLGDTFSAAGNLQATAPGERSVAVLYANGQPRVEPAGGWYGQTARIRTTFAAAAGQYSGVVGTDAAGLLPGMALGDRSTLDASLESAMKNTGLTHIVAVSGANCGFLLAFVFLLARSVRLPRSVAAAAGVLALLGFVLVVRPDASVLRAAVMGSLGTLAVLTGRGKLPAALLCLSITVLLAVDPWLSGSYAFILSVLATAGLILLGPRLTELLSRRLPWSLAAALAVPLAAQFFCSPVLVLLQPQVPVFSLPANVAVAPVVPLVTVAGMAAAVLAATVPALAVPFLLAAGAGAAWTAFVARSFSTLPGSLLPWPAGAPGVLLMAAAAGAGVWLLWRAGPGREERTGGEERTDGEKRRMGRLLSGRRASGRTHRRPDAAWEESGRDAATGWRKTVPAAALLLLLPPAASAAWTYMLPGPAPPGWTAAACDVGQGDGLVVRTGPNRAVVIDAGPDPDVMDRCLDRLGVETVDLFILSHAHLDHYGGSAGVLRDRQVHGIAYSTAEQQLSGPLREELEGAGAEMVHLTEGMAARIGTLQWEVLWPPGNGAQATENDASAVVLITVGAEDQPDSKTQPGRPQLTLLLTGDIEQEAAAAVLSRHAWLAADGVDVLKVPHHGARNGGTQLIEELRPSLALISVGADNDYGHPGPAILSALERAGTAVARTDLLGSIVLQTDGTTVKVRRLVRRALRG